MKICMGKTITCILIDDDPDDHEIFKIAIQETSMPVSCHFFHSWTEANKYLQNNAIFAPDFIFMDWYLSGVQGTDYLIRLKQIPKLVKSQFVVYSGFVQSDITLNLLETYNCKYLQKSGSITTTATELKAMLELAA